jgi:hypothetical protein
MNIREAKKLQNGDEVISKYNGESIKILNIVIHASGVRESKAMSKVLIEINGVGSKSGYNTWLHDEVK